MISKSEVFNRLSIAMCLALGTSHVLAADPLQLIGDKPSVISEYIETGDFSGVVNDGEDQKYLLFDFGNGGSNTEIVVDLPDLQTQKLVYSTLNNLGYVKNASKNPGTTELAAIYQYAIDTGLLVDDKEKINVQLAGIEFFAHNDNFSVSALSVVSSDAQSGNGVVQKSDASAACVLATVGCIAGLVEVTGECAAVITPAAPFMTGVCWARSVQEAVTCAGAVVACKSFKSEKHETKYTGAWADPDGATYFEGDYQNAWCDGTDRVDSIQVYNKKDPNANNYGMIRGIKLTCTNGAVKWVGSSTGAADMGSSTCKNDPHHLPQGVRIRYDQGYDSASAVGLICDRTFNTTAADTENELKGGSRGALASYKCPEGRYLVGLSYVLDAYGFVEALGPTCRVGVAP